MKNLIKILILIASTLVIQKGYASGKTPICPTEENSSQNMRGQPPTLIEKRNMKASLGPFFRLLPLEVLYQIMEDFEVSKILTSTSFGFFYLASTSSKAHFLLCDSSQNWTAYTSCPLLQQWPKVKISDTNFQIDHNNFSIHTIKNLTFLDVKKLDLWKKPHSVFMLGFLVNLKHLNIEQNNLNYLVHFLSPLENLTSLNINKNDLEEHASVIKNFPHLTALRMKDNRIGSYIDNVTFSFQLTSLDISKNWVLDRVGFLKSLTALTSLKIGKNALSKGSALLMYLTNLTHLDMYHNCLGINSAVLRALTRLKKLNVYSNCLGEDAIYLSFLTNLSSLNVANNNIENHVTALENLTLLTFLDVSRNNIREHFTILGSLTNLTFLDILQNNIADPRIREPKILFPSLTHLYSFKSWPQYLKPHDDD